MDWYAKTSEELYAYFTTNELGLSEDTILQKREKYGENRLPEAHKITYTEIFFRQFQSPLIYVLLIACVTVLFLGEKESSIFIGIVLLINAIIGTFQEGKAQNTLAALNHLIHTEATVVRNGIESIVLDHELVPGDIIILKEGDKIPADGRIISTNQLQVDESLLTGESDPVHKRMEVISGEMLSPQDQNNMVFCGTYVVGGTARIVIVATGAYTIIGAISVKLKMLDTDVPLKAEIKSFAKVLILIVVCLVTVLFFIGIYSGIPTKEMFAIAVAMAVSAVPEGLPVVVTLILATGVNRMSKKNVLIKNLQSVEALGQADVIAVDKTGTITMNQMMVQEVYTSSGVYTVTGHGYEPKGVIEQSDAMIDHTSRADLMLLGKVASLVATAQTAYNTEIHLWQRISGDPTEVALFVLGQKLGLNKFVLETENVQKLYVPFSSQTRFCATVNEVHGTDTLFVTGSPEVLLQKSVFLWSDKGMIPITAVERQDLEKEMEKMLRRGLRVIALATATEYTTQIKEGVLPALTLIGFVGILDVIRDEVYAAVERVHAAGIRVVMITGDHISTAQSIGSRIGIYTPGDHILTGTDLDTMSKSELRAKIIHTSIFARVTPDHKLAIITAYKDAGIVIAMTGDGVNDALSLAAADLGVSMGKAGTEVAKEASDIVLLDDNFGSIVGGVEEGRNIYKTIKKVVLYLISTGLGEILAITGAIIAGFVMPFSASQIIWLNFVTDGFLVIALAMEPKESGILNEKIKHNGGKLLSKDMFVRMFIMGFVMMVGTLILFSFYSADFLKASTMAVTVLAVYQWCNVLNCRHEKKSIFQINFFSNVYLLFALLAVIVLQVIAVYTPWFNRFLHMTPITLYDWWVILATSLSIIVVDEIYKLIRYGKKRD